jgi:cytochrome c
VGWEIELSQAIPGQLLWEQGGEMRHVALGKKRKIRQCFAALPVQQPPARKLSGDKGALWLDRSGCTTCHEPYAKSVGPGYAQIAERYQSQENALPQLVQKVRQGGSGNWGSSLMPAHPQLDEGALKSMIRYMLRFQPSKAAKTTSAPAPKVVDPEVSAPVPNPGHGAALAGLHPSLSLTPIRPAHFRPRVGGMAFLPDSSLLVSTWDSVGAVYRLQNVCSGDISQIRILRIAEGLAEPLGLEVVDGEIFVLQKQELTQLIDEDGDGITDTYRNVCDDWGATADFHEFSYGLLWHQGHFWANLGLAMRLMEHETQHPDRGQTIRISPEGQFEAVNSGLRQPNGIGLGPEGEVFLTENQGRWVPACKIVHVQEGAFYGCRLGEVPPNAEERYRPPAVWLPQDEIGNSPGELTTIPSGRYAGQLLHGEVTHGGLKRVFLEKVQGQFQGCVFRFTQGLEAGINRLTWGPDGALYVGGVGMNGNWGWQGNQYGLQRLSWNAQSTFEMLAVRLLPNGLEIELTEPIAAAALTAGSIQVEQWHYLATERYGGPKRDLTKLKVSDLRLQADRRTIQLSIPGLQAGKVVYLRLPETLRSEAGRPLWSSEAWYTLNQLR